MTQMKHDIITPVQSEAAGLKHIKLEAHNKVLILVVYSHIHH